MDKNKSNGMASLIEIGNMTDEQIKELLEGSSSAESTALAERFKSVLRTMRSEARRKSVEEEAERQRIARQKEREEAEALGRLARETMIGNVTVADFLKMDDAERQSIVGAGDGRLNEQRNAMLEFLQKERTRKSDGGKFSYWNMFMEEHPGVFNV